MHSPSPRLSPSEIRFLQGIDINLIEGLLVPLYITFILLNFGDILTTLIAFKGGVGFVEFNPLAAYLFSKAFAGFILAYLFKLVPAVPLLYMTFAKRSEAHDAEVRLLRLAAFAVLAVTDVYFGFIVFGNNLPSLAAAGLI